MLEAVFFDLDDTLHNSTDLSRKARRTAVEHMVSKGLKMGPDEAYEALMRVVRKYGSNYGQHLDRFFTDELGRPPDYRMIAAAVIAYHHTKFVNLRPYPHTVETVIELRVKGLKLGVITDGLPVKQWEKLIRLGLDGFFDTVVISGGGESSRSKPNPEIFMEAVDRLGTKPENSMMVGDKLHTDVDGANKAGMVSVWLRTPRDPPDLPDRMGIRPDHVVEDIRDVLDLVGR